MSASSPTVLTRKPLLVSMNGENRASLSLVASATRQPATFSDRLACARSERIRISAACTSQVLMFRGLPDSGTNRFAPPLHFMPRKIPLASIEAIFSRAASRLKKGRAPGAAAISATLIAA